MRKCLIISGDQDKANVRVSFSQSAEADTLRRTEKMSTGETFDTTDFINDTTNTLIGALGARLSPALIIPTYEGGGGSREDLPFPKFPGLGRY